MCYGYYTYKGMAGKENAATETKTSSPAETASTGAGLAAASQAEQEKAVARFLARVRQIAAREQREAEASTR